MHLYKSWKYRYKKKMPKRLPGKLRYILYTKRMYMWFQYNERSFPKQNRSLHQGLKLRGNQATSWIPPFTVHRMLTVMISWTDATWESNHPWPCDSLCISKTLLPTKLFPRRQAFQTMIDYFRKLSKTLLIKHKSVQLSEAIIVCYPWLLS